MKMTSKMYLDTGWTLTSSMIKRNHRIENLIWAVFISLLCLLMIEWKIK